MHHHGQNTDFFYPYYTTLSCLHAEIPSPIKAKVDGQKGGLMYLAKVLILSKNDLKKESLSKYSLKVKAYRQCAE
jgi:hypothetical protein